MRGRRNHFIKNSTQLQFQRIKYANYFLTSFKDVSADAIYFIWVYFRSHFVVILLLRSHLDHYTCSVIRFHHVIRDSTALLAHTASSQYAPFLCHSSAFLFFPQSVLTKYILLLYQRQILSFSSLRVTVTCV